MVTLAGADTAEDDVAGVSQAVAGTADAVGAVATCRSGNSGGGWK